MSERPAPPSVSEAALPWDRRPVATRDRATVAGVMVFTCSARVALVRRVLPAPEEWQRVVQAELATEQIQF